MTSIRSLGWAIVFFTIIQWMPAKAVAQFVAELDTQGSNSPPASMSSLPTHRSFANGSQLSSNSSGSSLSLASSNQASNSVLARNDIESLGRVREVSNKSNSLYVENWSMFDEFTALLAMDGSKQPQDFGVNANAGLQGSVNWGLPVLPTYGLGMQLGTNYTATQNAVRVYELLGETRSRYQSFTTVGFFQRLENGFSWGGVYDFLHEDSYDSFSLGQWRVRASLRRSAEREIGVTANLRANSDAGVWGSGTQVTLRSINQGSAYWRRYWSTGAQTTIWGGLADRHGEDNIVTGPSPAQKNSFLFGADVLMPLNRSWAIYGETNMITPFDTGTVDAFLGVQWYPTGRTLSARRGWFSPLFSTASPVSFAVDLLR